MRQQITYFIHVDKEYLEIALAEINFWQTPKQTYKVEGNTIITKSSDVVDVVNETFINAPEFYRVVGVLKAEKADAWH